MTSTQNNDERHSPEWYAMKAQLEQSRRNISSTVGEIENRLGNMKGSVGTGVSKVQTAVTDALDWRKTVRRHSGKVLSAAFVAGLVAGGNARGIRGLAVGAALAASRIGRTLRSNASHQVASGASRMAQGIVSEALTAGRNILLPALVARIAAAAHNGHNNDNGHDAADDEPRGVKSPNSTDNS